jgi:Concanavalin A-like lectin/glucanases superfamily
MLDEASGPRASAPGTVTGDSLTESPGPISGNTTDKIEGTASAQIGIASGDWSLSAPPATSNFLDRIAAPFTCMLWFRYTDGAGGSATLINAMDGTDGFLVDYQTTPQTVRFMVRSSSVTNTYTSTRTLPFNAWNHVAVGRNATNTTSFLYVNGALDGGKANAYFPPHDVFSLSAAVNGFWQGQFDEAACFGNALSAEAICRICSCGIRGEQCTCSGTSFASTGRNATLCGSCALPADCSAGTPP